VEVRDIEKLIEELPSNSFVGTNNVRNYLCGFITLDELKEFCFLGFALRADGRWTTWK